MRGNESLKIIVVFCYLQVVAAIFVSHGSLVSTFCAIRVLVLLSSSTMTDLSTNRRVFAICVFFSAVSAFLTGEAAFEEPTRIWGEKCTKSDIVINQGPTAPLPTGIPTYTVEVVNACVTGCDIYSIHFKCGWFSSAHLINPRVFKRLRYDDCLVNDGKPLVYGGTLSFQYANTFPYPLSVSRVVCN